MPKVNAKASDGCTALAFALDCTSDDDRAIECAKLLLDARADVTRIPVVLRCFFWDGKIQLESKHVNWGQCEHKKCPPELG